MPNPEHLAILKQGVEVWNRWRQENPLIKPDLRRAELYGLISPGMDLSGAEIGSAILLDKNLSDINFSKADLGSAVLIWSGMRRSNFSGANLYGTNFTSSDLSDANLSGAILGDTVFGGTNLRGTMGLDSCKHERSSILDHQTLAISGQLPLSFLRGCGLPNSLIEYLPSLLNQPIQFYSCFISYSTEDQGFADRLHADLQNAGVRCWFAPHDIQGGKKIHDQIDEAIRIYDRLLLILSEHSMNSEWVKTEIANARQRELREKRQMLFPISLAPFEKIKKWKAFDGDTGKDSAREIREYFIPDFADWKDHDSYQAAFQRLLRDLKAEVKPL